MERFELKERKKESFEGLFARKKKTGGGGKGKTREMGR